MENQIAQKASIRILGLQMNLSIGGRLFQSCAPTFLKVLSPNFLLDLEIL